MEPSDATVTLGEGVSVQCVAVGHPRPLILWSALNHRHWLLPLPLPAPRGPWVNLDGTLIIPKVNKL